MKIFRTVALKSMKKNRTRTLVTIIGVILSVAMFTAVTTAISTLYGHLERVAAYEHGSYYLGFSTVAHEALTEMRADPDTKQLAAGEYLGYAKPENKKLREEQYLYVLSMGGNFSDLLPVHLTSGRMPQTASEILLPDHLPTLAAVGESLTLTLGDRTLDGQPLGQNTAYMQEETFVPRQTRSYTIVGTYARPDFEPAEGPGYTALTVGEGASTGVFDVYVQTKSAATPALDAYAARYEGRSAGTPEYNWSYLRMKGNLRYDNLDSSLYGFCAILFAMIMVGAVSLIYSAFSISVSERTKQFGLLSSIGATRKQLRKTVIYEAYTVSLIGIPLGLLAGCGGMWVTFALLGDRMSSLFGAEIPLRFSVSLPALVVAALVGLLTVRISAMIPARRAMRVTAIEAIRQSRDVRAGGRLSSGKLAYRLFGLPGMLSKKYFQRSRKKYRATILSLAMSLLLFISASTYGMYLTSTATDVASVSGFDYYYAADNLTVEDAQALAQTLKSGEGIARAWCVAEKNRTAVPAENLLSEEFRQYLIDRQGTNAVESAWSDLLVMVDYVDDAAYAAICAEAGISPAAGSPVLQNRISQVTYTEAGRFSYDGSVLRSGTTELSVFSRQEIPGYDRTGARTQEKDGTWMEEYVQNPEDEYWLTHEISAEPEQMLRPAQTETFRIGAELRSSAYSGNSAYYGPAVFLPMSALREEAVSLQVMVVASDADKARETLKETLQEKIPGFREADVYDAHEDERNTRDMLTVIRVFSYGFITLISLICVANVFNTISTNVALRRRDFAMLRSVGMTQGGIYRMMVYECLRYGLFALGLGLPLSAGVAYLIWRASYGIAPSTFLLPWKSIAVAVVSVFLVVFVSMLYAVGKIRRDNPVETLKEENI